MKNQTFSGRQASVVVGISYRQLDYWARTGLVEPSIRPAHGSGSQRLYSFRDILVLKVVKRLLDTGVPAGRIALVRDGSPVSFAGLAAPDRTRLLHAGQQFAKGRFVHDSSSRATRLSAFVCAGVSSPWSALL